MTYTLINKGLRGRQLDHAQAALSSVAARVVGLDTETTGLSPLDSKLRLVQLAIGDDGVFIFDMRDLPGWALPALRRIIENPEIIKVAHNAKFDAKFLLFELGIEPRGLADTLLMSQLLAGGDMMTHHGLDDAVRMYLGLRMDKTEQKGNWDVDELSDEQLEYAAEDARVLVPLFARMVEHLRMDDLLRVAKLEFDCIVPVADMELAGFPLDADLWSKLLATKTETRDRLQAELTEMMKPGIDWMTKNSDRPRRPVKPKLKKKDPGYDAAMELYEREMTAWRQIPSELPGLINLGSPVQVKNALTNITGIDFVKLTSRDHVLELYADKFPVVAKMQEYRSADKLVTSYGENWIEAIDDDGRIRPDIQMIGAETGRMACRKPNIQQPPADHAPDKETGICPGCHRCCFVAPPGRKLIISDYSQIELRIAADFSGDEKMIEAFNNDIDLHQQTAEEVDVTRSDAKILNFAIPYGVGPTKFGAQAGVTFDEAKDIIGRHAETYPGLHGWLRSAADMASTRRFTRTSSGRLMRFSADEADYHELRKALSGIGRNGKNGPIQGTSADILKRAVRLVYDALRGTSGKIVNLVHDEIVVEADDAEAEGLMPLINAAMVQAGREFITRVPIKVESAVMEAWTK